MRSNKRMPLILSLLFTLLITRVHSPYPVLAQVGAECLNIASGQLDRYTSYPTPRWWQLYDPRTQQLTPDHRVNQGIPLVSPDGQYAIYSELFPHDLTGDISSVEYIVLRILRQSDGQVIFEYKSQGLPPGIGWSPDSRWVAISGLTDGMQVTLIELLTGNTVKLEDKLASSWSPDSKYLLMFSVNNDGQMQSILYLWSVEQRATLEVASQVRLARWDPTGTYLAFSGTNTAAQPYLGIYTAATSDLKFYPRPGVQTQMHWSPSGRYLVLDGRIFDPTRGEIVNFGGAAGMGTQAETIFFSPDESLVLYSTWAASTVWRADLQTGEVTLLLNRINAYDDRGLLWISVNEDRTVSIETPNGDGWTILVDNIKPVLDAAFAATATAFAATATASPEATAAAATATARVDAFTYANPSVIQDSLSSAYVSPYVSPNSRSVVVIWAEPITVGQLRWHMHLASADDHFQHVHKLTLYDSIDLATLPLPRWFAQGDFVLLIHPQADGHDARIINLQTGEIAVSYENLTLATVLGINSEQDGAALWWQDNTGATAIDVYDNAGVRIIQLDTSSIAANITWNTTGILVRSPQGQLAVYWNGLIGMPNSSWAVQLFDTSGHPTQVLSRPDAELYPRAIHWISCP